MMTTVTDGPLVVEQPIETVTEAMPQLAATALLGLIAAALGVAGFVLSTDHSGVHPADVVRLVLIVGWAAGGVAVAREASTRALGLIVLSGTTVAGLRSIAAGLLERGDAVALAELAEPVAASLVLAAGFHLVLSVPSGLLQAQARRTAALSGYAVAVLIGLFRWAEQPTPPRWPLVVGAGVAIAAGLPASNRRYLDARGVTRQRLQWLGLAVALLAEIALIVLALRLLLGWPDAAPEVIAAALLLVPAALIAGSSRRLVGQVDRLLSHTVSLAGLSALVVIVYLVIVVGLGRVPTDDERTILVLSMLAAAVAGLLFLPTRERLTEIANRVVYGEARDPGEALETFGTRLTRALPMDELLLQLAELLRKHMALVSAEVWSGTEGRLERAAAVPDRGPGTLAVGEKELPVVTRAGVSGRAWASVWLPAALEGHGGGPLRVVPMANGGELFGLIAVERRLADDEFTEEDERVLTELARQVGLALKNSSLDSALQETLKEVQRTNVELQASRARIVATADAERRKIERNLHDGAQQHLVALAVKLRLIRTLAERDVEQAIAMIEEARGDVQATVDEVRALAHGIYPKLLMDLGLGDALQAAAGRAALPTRVTTEGVGRYPEEVEAAVYFCCLEALQNAGKHAGDGAEATVHVVDDGTLLQFEVVDDGAGFALADRSDGHGFVNMADRLGAIGGTVNVESAPGHGTKIRGAIPI